MERLRAWIWDVVQFFLGTNAMKMRLVSSAIEQPCRVLEIGCATGNIAAAFAASDYTGIDTDPAVIERARRKFAGRGYSFVCGDVCTTQFPAPFDVVVLSATVHHLSDEALADILRAAHRRLTPQGRLVVLDLERPAPGASLRSRFYRWMDQGKHFRTAVETETSLSPLFRADGSTLHPSIKWGVRVIDQYLIVARRSAP